MWNYDATTIVLANDLFPTELSLLPSSEWAAYMRTNKTLMLALMNFWADCDRVAVYRNNGLTSWPIVQAKYDTTSGTKRIDPVNAIRLNYLFNLGPAGNNTVLAFRTAADVQRTTTNYNTKYIGYS